jgi:hypothetical protein
MLELLKKYPEAAKEVKSYYLELMLESLNNESLPEDFKDHVRAQGIDDEKIAKIAEGSPRNLFDVFDVNGIFIEISVSHNDFSYKIYPRDQNFLDVIWYHTRKEAEEIAIKDAFQLLNEKLCQTES